MHLNRFAKTANPRAFDVYDAAGSQLPENPETPCLKDKTEKLNKEINQSF